jgi:hypothetical protein
MSDVPSLFEDIFDVTERDPDGKYFDRGVTLDRFNSHCMQPGPLLGELHCVATACYRHNVVPLRTGNLMRKHIDYDEKQHQLK